MAKKARSLETLLSLENQRSTGFWPTRSGLKRSEAATARQPRHLEHTPASVRHTHDNQHHWQPTDVVDTELNNLETLHTIDNSLPLPNRTPTRHYQDTGGGRGGDDGPTITPEQQTSLKKPQDPSLRHVPCTGMEFEDLSYAVVKHQQQKDGVWITREDHLLHGITGVASKGEVTAIMGPRGAGKSTLLDALAGRITSGSLGGFTLVDGLPVTPTLMKRMSAYIMQDDQLFPMLTVWETLWFAAEVRLHRNMSRNEKQERVIKLIDQLELTNVQNKYIGDEKTRGISGGEKRRVSIGVDIIHGPALLFMDEPTYGLDSTSAYSVIEKVHDIARAGSTVILTIHDPSCRIMQLLDRLIILARGQLIYQGGPNYLSTQLAGFGIQVPVEISPVEYLLDVVIQEYDQCPYGVAPLVLYNLDGTKLTADDLDASIRSMRTPVSEYTQSTEQPHRSMISEEQLSKSPLGYQRKSVKADDDSDEAMEVGNSPDEAFDGAFDHSITREAPKVASLYYKGLIEGLANRFFTPRASPARRLPTSPMPGTPTSIALPSPMQRTPTRMVQQSPLSRTDSKTSLRSSSMTQARQFHQKYKGSSEIGPATPTPTPTPGPTPHSSDYTVTERDYEILDYEHEAKFANFWWREVIILMIRNMKNFQRTPALFLSRLLTLIIMGFMVATFSLKVRKYSSNPNGVTSILSFFIFTVCLILVSSIDAVPAFITEKFIYTRETSHDAYRASSYVIASAIVSLPFLAIQSIAYVLITWWALGFQNTGTEAFFFFFLILFVSLFCTSSFVMFVSSIVPNYILGYAIVLVFTGLYFVSCGYFIHRSDIPTYWIWLHYISILKYPYEAMLLNEFGGHTKHQLCFFCESTSGQCSLTGKSLLERLDVTQLTKWESLAVLLGMAVIYRFLFYCVLRFGSRSTKAHRHLM